MNDLISVIVPVYNVEQYLNKCIESIVNQTYSNLEIILVDDGSPDNCPQICDDWANRDSRIKVIHQQNQGGGPARNVALDIAKGKFISFVDSDDYISPVFYENMVSFMSGEVDIVECDYTEVNDENASFSLDNFLKDYAVEEALKCNIEDSIFKQLIWNKLYKREIIKNIRFPDSKGIDDEFWTYKIIGNANKLRRINSVLYAYRQQNSSVMHIKFSLSRLNAILAKAQRVEYIRKKYPKLESIARINLWFTCLFLGQKALVYLDKADEAKAFELIRNALSKEKLKLLDYNNLTFKYKAWLLLSSISIRLVCKIRNYLKVGL